MLSPLHLIHGLIEIIINQRSNDCPNQIPQYINPHIPELIDFPILQISQKRKHNTNREVQAHPRQRREPSADIHKEADYHIPLDFVLDVGGVGVGDVQNEED